MCPALEAAAPSLLRPWFSSYIDDWTLQASEPSTVGYIASPCQVMAYHMPTGLLAHMLSSQARPSAVPAEQCLL